MTDSKKLIEVALPLEAINVACKADKDRKTGSVRSLHKWFAPMPSAAWRALLFAALIDDPADEAGRLALLRLVESLCPSDGRPPSQSVLDKATSLLEKQFGRVPTVCDPFCGAGTTLLEAQRLGLPAVGSDLNPVPVLIARFLTSIVPTVADHPVVSNASASLVQDGVGLSGFVTDLMFYAAEVQRDVWKEIGSFYPAGPNGDPVIAWRWARTVPSPDPRFQDAMTPLVGDWWLSKKKGIQAFVAPKVDRESQNVTFEIETRGSPPAPSKGECLFSGSPISFGYVREQGREDRLGLVMMAVITHGSKGRAHFAPDNLQIAAAAKVPETDLRQIDLPDRGLGLRIQEYGMKHWSDLFTPRQVLALVAFAKRVSTIDESVRRAGGSAAYAHAIAVALGLCVGKLAGFMSSQSLWRMDSRNGSAKAEAAFGRAALPMTFDFVEVNPFGGSVGDWMQIADTFVRGLSDAALRSVASRVEQRDARTASDLVDGPTMIATDPPYFDQIGYSDLSDYFYVWLRIALGRVEPELFSTIVTPKAAELIADPSRHGGDESVAKAFFIEGFTETFHQLAAIADSRLPFLVVYAFKQQESSASGGQASTGWEAMLEAVLRAGLAIVGTWPIYGTGSTRQRSQASNALATYVVLVCRPRPADAGVTTRRDLRGELKRVLGPAVADLQSASVAPVDLAQASIGPGMAVFSRYQRVVEADGGAMTVREALSLINQVLDESLSEQENDFDSDTRWALAWFEEYGVNSGPFGKAESLSKAKNTSVNGLVAAGLLESSAGKVRLLDRSELSTNWDPATDRRLTVWEVVQYLIRALDEEGELGAAQLLRRLGGLGDTGRELAYRLYAICERKKWAKEAIAYNSLVVAWPEVVRLASTASTATQETLL